jgi:hypothetical protein
VKPDVKLPAKPVGETLTGVSGGMGGVSTVGDLFVDLKLEGGRDGLATTGNLFVDLKL